VNTQLNCPTFVILCTSSDLPAEVSLTYLFENNFFPLSSCPAWSHQSFEEMRNLMMKI